MDPSAMKNNVTADIVTKKIEDSLKPDNKLTDSEKQEIDALYKKVGTKQGKEKVTEFIKSKFSGETEKELLALTKSVEIIKGDFTMDTLAKNSKSKFFNIILKKENKGLKIGLLGYKSVIGNIFSEKLGKNKQILKGHDEILEVIYWKKITDEIGFKSAGGMMKDKVAGFFSSIVGKVGKIGEESQTEEMDLSKMGDLVTKIAKIGDKPDEEGMKKLSGIMGKIKGYLDYMTKGYTENLNVLLDLGKKEDKEGLKKLLDNPVVLDEVLKTGKYNKDGYNIDLENGKVSFNSNPDIARSKTEFMKLAIEANNGNGGKLDALKKKTKQLANTFKNIGLDASTLRDFRDGLKDIPLIGEFLFALVSFFLGDSMLNLMEGNPWEKEYKTSGKNLTTFIKDNKDSLPFVVGEEDFEDVIVAGQVESFLGKVKTANKNNFNNIEENKKQLDPSYNKGEVTSLIDNKDFWKNIFSDKEPTDPILKQLWKKAKTLKDKELSTEDFFKEMNKNLVINITLKNKVLSPEEKELEDLKQKEAQKLNSTDKDLLISEIGKITKVPAEIKIKDSAGIEKELKLDFKDSKLSVNNKEFILKEGELLDISFDKDNAILKIKQSDGTEIEKKVTKNEFAQIIAGLAVGVSVVGSIFILPKDKKLEKLNTQKEELSKETKEFQEKKKELEKELPKIQEEIDKLNEENGINIKEKTNLEKLIKSNETKISDFDKEIEKNEIEIEKNEDRNIEIYDIISDENYFVNLFNNGDLLKESKEKVRKNRDLKRENGKILKKIKKLESDIGNFKKELTELNKKIDEKQTIIDSKKQILKNKQQELKNIITKLGATKEELKEFDEKINTQKKAEEQAKKDADKKAKEEELKRIQLEETIEKQKNKKSFQELLENPAKVEDLKLTLSDGTEISFDKTNYSLKIGNEEYKAQKLDTTKKFILKKLSFKSIYKNEDFIKVLNDLKENGKAKFMGIEIKKS